MLVSFPDTEQAFCFWLNMFHRNEVLSCTDQNTSLSLHDRQFGIFLEEILIYQNKFSTLPKCNDFFCLATVIFLGAETT